MPASSGRVRSYLFPLIHERNQTMRMLLTSVAIGTLTFPAMAQNAAVDSYHQTKYQNLEQSMEALLDGGYTIVNLSVIPTGANFLLRRSDKWVICSLKGFQQSGQVAVGSLCVALN
jgi:hypothetical protein